MFVVLQGAMHASTVTPIDAIATSSWFAPISPERVIDGSGLSSTDPQTILSATHDNNPAAATMWHAGPNDAGLDGPTGNPPVADDQEIIFVMPGLVDLTHMYIWNHNQAGRTSRGVDEFDLLVSSNADPLSAVFSPVGTFSLTEAGGAAEPAQAFAFTSTLTNVRLAKFAINSAQSGATNEFVGLSEVRFEDTRPFNSQQFIQWGLETQTEILATMRAPGSALMVETAHLDGSTSGGVGGRAFAWPLSAQFRAYDSLVQYDPATYGPVLRAFSDELRAEYWSEDGGYFCCRGGGDRFYDDNSHLAVALAEAYEATGEQVYLDRARETFDFLLTGEAPGYEGGSYWSVQDHSFLDTSSSLQGAKAALMLYQATGDSQYLTDARRKYNWAHDTTQLDTGLFLEKYYLKGPKAGTSGDYDLIHYAGYSISANVLFFETTGEVADLREAQRIAAASLDRYFDPATGHIRDEGQWAYELVDGLMDLYEVDGDSRWLDAVIGAMEWLHENKRDPNGHYGLFWGRNGPQTEALTEWNLNDQAPVTRAYLRLGLTSPADIPGDFDGDRDVDGLDFLAWQRGGADEIELPKWQAAFGLDLCYAGGETLVATPEPQAALLALLSVTQFAFKRRILSRVNT